MMDWDEIDLRQVFLGSLLLSIGIGIGVFEMIVPEVVGMVSIVGLWSSVGTVSVMAELKVTDDSSSIDSEQSF